MLRTPAIAERRDDSPVLAALFLRRRSPQARLAADALALLDARDWPGNVRELRALIELAAALTPATVIDAATLRFAAGETMPEAASLPNQPVALDAIGALDAAIARRETRMIQDAMGAAANN